jgi:hypothetical protein
MSGVVAKWFVTPVRHPACTQAIQLGSSPAELDDDFGLEFMRDGSQRAHGHHRNLPRLDPRDRVLGDAGAAG